MEKRWVFSGLPQARYPTTLPGRLILYWVPQWYRAWGCIPLPSVEDIKSHKMPGLCSWWPFLWGWKKDCCVVGGTFQLHQSTICACKSGGPKKMLFVLTSWAVRDLSGTQKGWRGCPRSESLMGNMDLLAQPGVTSLTLTWQHLFDGDQFPLKELQDRANYYYHYHRVTEKWNTAEHSSK